MNTPTGVVLQQTFEEWNRKVLFKKSHAKYNKLDPRYLMLIDSLFCNPKLAGKIYKATKMMRLKSNQVKILITHKARVAGYKPHVWFD